MDDKTREFLDENKSIVLEARKIREDKTIDQRAKQLYSSAKNNSKIINDLVFSRVLKSFMEQYYDDKDVLIVNTYNIFTDDEISKLQKSTLSQDVFLKYKADGYDEKFCSNGEEINLIESSDDNYFIPFIYEKELYESLGIKLGYWFGNCYSFSADKEEFEKKLNELVSNENKKYKENVLKPMLELFKFFNKRDKIKNDFYALSKQNANLILLESYKQILELYKDNNLGENEKYTIKLEYIDYDKTNDSFRHVYSNKILNNFLELNVRYYRFITFVKYDNDRIVTYLPLIYNDLSDSDDVLNINSRYNHIEVFIYQQDLENLILGLDEDNERKLKQ